ncbi:MAG: EAL domain-containing protein [Methylophilaceae bacterium]|nr:EAL domain-containing protein [Methylophilaceae bacterium]
MADSLASNIKFTSLRWKLMVTLVLVTCVVGASLALLFYQFLMDQYTQSRNDALSIASKQVNGLLDQQRQQLQQIASTLPKLSPNWDDTSRADAPLVNEAWSALQLDMGLDSIHFFTPQGQEQARLGEFHAKPFWQKLILESIASEAPVSFIDCSEKCHMVALAPVLSGQHLTGIFAVSATLADTVLAFHKISHADIAMLATHRGSAKPRIEAASSPSTTHEVLKKFLLMHQETPNQKALITLANNSFEVAALALSPANLALSSANQSAGVQLLLIENVNAKLLAVHSTIRHVFFLILGQLFVMLALLYLLLTRPLERLLRISKALPMLGNGAFAELRNIISPRKTRNWQDEVDLLDRTSIDLSHRLQYLEAAAVEHTLSLKQALNQVSREKVFTSNLLDKAQAMIVVSDHNGNILTLNRYGIELTGYSGQQLTHTPFISSPMLKDAEPGICETLLLLMSEEEEPHLRHESDVSFANGSLHKVAWSHSWLPDTLEGHGVLLSMGMDITERIQNEVKLAYLADHDTLTGCFNRRRFQAELERMLETAKRYSMQGALLYFDLDHFKNINDTSGHQAGDALLQRVITELRMLLRNVDIIGRMGGDEFAIATLDTNALDAPLVAQRINDQLATISLADLGLSQRVSASIGIVTFSGEDISVRDLLAHADIAMYQAKGAQRGSWHLYSQAEKIRERLRETLDWEKRIQEGMSLDRFELHYQPILCLHDNSIHHYEALLRLRVDSELVAPGDFLEIALLNGQIRELDAWVMHKAIQQLALISGQHPDISFAINLSAVNIGNVKLLLKLKQQIQESQIDPRRIIFEITETAAVTDFSAANEFIHTIREIGCAFALDDFGSGFASFYYLKQFPVDYIKIDGSFIRNLAESPDDQIFVRAMVDIARAYGKKTVAEFVENAKTMDLLRQYGVDYAQGYHIGKPAPFGTHFEK